jgi:hypothetical protein
MTPFINLDIVQFCTSCKIAIWQPVVAVTSLTEYEPSCLCVSPRPLANIFIRKEQKGDSKSKNAQL